MGVREVGEEDGERAGRKQKPRGATAMNWGAEGGQRGMEEKINRRLLTPGRSLRRRMQEMASA